MYLIPVFLRVLGRSEEVKVIQLNFAFEHHFFRNQLLIAELFHFFFVSLSFVASSLGTCEEQRHKRTAD
jgi:hypothetical protein